MLHKINSRNNAQKNIAPLYLEHLSFLIKRAGWLVTKIYWYFSCEQERFRKYFFNEPKIKTKSKKFS